VNHSIYYEVAKSLEKNPFGVPKKDGDISEAFIGFLGLIYTLEEAGVVRYLDVYPFFKTAQQVANESDRDVD